MCQPPRQMIETRSPVLPSGRVGNPLAEASSAPGAPAVNVKAAPAASEVCKNSRRLLGMSIIASLLKVRVVGERGRVSAPSAVALAPRVRLSRGANATPLADILFRRGADGKQVLAQGNGSSPCKKNAVVSYCTCYNRQRDT